MCCRRWLGRKSLIKCCRHCCSWLPLMASPWWLLCSDGGLQQRTRKKKDKGRGKKRVIWEKGRNRNLSHRIKLKEKT
ncbi:hypothetical protein AAZX31_10G013100 [Glycine max]